MADVVTLEDLNPDNKNAEQKFTSEESSINRKIESNAFNSLVPPFIQDFCNKPNSVGLRISYDAPTNQSTFHYSISWEVETIDTEALWRKNRENKIRTETVCSERTKTMNAEQETVSIPCTEPINSKTSSITSQIVTSGSASSMSSTITNASFKLIYPTENEIITAKLVIVEPSEEYGMTFAYTSVKTNASDFILEPISKMLLRKKRRDIKYLSAGTLYYAVPQSKTERKMRLIEKDKYNSLSSQKIPKIDDSVVFVLDLGGYVEDGKEIYFK